MTALRFVSYVQPATGAAIGMVDGADTDPRRPAVPPPRAELQGIVTVTEQMGQRPVRATSGPLTVMGPASVVGIDPAQIVGRYPSPGATGVEAITLAAVELASPDLPWRFSPARAGPAERLRPWIVLVVVPEATEIVSGDPAPRMSVATSELPDLAESWAWAHAQLEGDGADPTSGMARLLCPRKLEPNQRWRAAIVPGFLGGVQAGLADQPVDPAMAHEPAWTTAQAAVTLPVYDHWEFATGEDADFEALARRILPARPSELEGFGTRSVDVARPWPGDEATGPAAIEQLGGALRPLGNAPDDQLTGEQADELHRRLAAAVAASAAGDLGPPLRGRHHARRTTIAVDGGDWVDQVNRNPVRRLAASRGAEWVIAHQEELMAAAWKQAADIRAAAQRIALARAALAVNESLQRRHIDTLGTDELVAVVAPSAKRSRVASGAQSPTLGAVFAASAAPDGSTTVAFARQTRRASRVGRMLGRGAQPVTHALAGRLVAGTPDAGVAALAGAAGRAGSPPTQAPPAGSLAALLADRVAGAQVAAIATAATTVWLAQQTDLDAPESTEVASLATPDQFSAGPELLAAAIVGAGSGAAMVKAIGQDRLGAPTLIAAGAEPPARDVTVGVEGLQLTATALSAILRPAADVGTALRRRMAATVVGGVNGDVGAPADLDPVLLTPDVPTPMALALVERDPDAFIPGLGRFPPDRSTLLTPDSSFAEAVLLGANDELLGEMVWREFPTDQRGTPMRRFWPRPDHAVDVEPIHRWSGNLGTHMDIDHANTSVILIRAEVLHRYPSTVILATPASVKPGTNPAQLVPSGSPTQWMEPIFTVPVDPSTRAVAFAIPSAGLRQPATVDRPGWFFVFVEPTHRLRFGFDLDGPDRPTTPNDVAWRHVLDPARPFASATVDAGLPRQGDGPVWGGPEACAADVARIAAQQPVRLALHSSRMVDTGP